MTGFDEFGLFPQIQQSSKSRGPRIKHVCRRAAMVFPGQRATFPPPPPSLSALPRAEKQEILAQVKGMCIH